MFEQFGYYEAHDVYERGPKEVDLEGSKKNARRGLLAALAGWLSFSAIGAQKAFAQNTIESSIGNISLPSLDVNIGSESSSTVEVSAEVRAATVMDGKLAAYLVKPENYSPAALNGHNVNVWMLTKLQANGYVQRGSIADLSGLTPKGRTLLKYYNKSEVQALLAAIRYGEGTLHDLGYNTVFGGGKVYDLSRHPMKVWNGSSAAGAYQAMNYTWPSVSEAAGLRDFTPLSQDLFALHQMVYKHGIDLDNYDDSQFQNVIYKLSYEWASLPGPNGMSRYTFKGRPQPAKSMAALWRVYADAREGNVPRMGKDYDGWTDAHADALRRFQFDHEVKVSGVLDDETKAVMFAGFWGSSGKGQPNPFAAAPSSNNGVARGAQLYAPVEEGTPYYLRLVHTGAGNKYSNGLDRLKLQLVDNRGEHAVVIDEVWANSGQARAQDFWNERSMVRGTYTPAPQGVYKLSNTTKSDGYIRSSSYQGNGISWMWATMTPVTNVGSRASLGIHGDSGPSGTAGCVGLLNRQDSHHVANWITEYGADTLVIDYGII